MPPLELLLVATPFKGTASRHFIKYKPFYCSKAGYVHFNEGLDTYQQALWPEENYVSYNYTAQSQKFIFLFLGRRLVGKSPDPSLE